MDFSVVRPIRNEEQYRAMLEDMKSVWGAKPNSNEGDLLEILLLLVEDYEKKHHAIKPLDAVEAIKYEMEENGLTQKDLIPYFGSKARVSEVLNRKRPLTLSMVKKLYHGLGIPADTLLAV